MWQVGNFLYLIISPKGSPSLYDGYSPLLKINLNSNDFTPSFVPLENAPEVLLRDCLNLDEFVILFARENDGRAPSYVLSKDLLLIARE